MNPLRLIVGGIIMASLFATTTRAASPALHVGTFADTGIRLTDIVWTGHRFLYVENTSNQVFAAGPSGMPAQPFAAMPREVEETRCAVAPGGHGFPAGDIYCHSPLNTLYRISPDGKSVNVFAVLPDSSTSDGALTFDTVGRFGYGLVAATGRSGSADQHGGTVFRIDHTGAVHRVGAYRVAGGADEITIAPPRFGSASGQVLLAVDAGSQGRVVAMDRHGRTRTLLKLSDGPNPIVSLVSGLAPRAGAARPGLYVTDTVLHTVFFVAASELRSYAGAVLVGSEVHGLFWVVRPRGSGFGARRLSTDLPAQSYNLEGAIYLHR
jgi:hypothetical protein